jgi:hypothetical protein
MKHTADSLPRSAPVQNPQTVFINSHPRPNPTIFVSIESYAHAGEYKTTGKIFLLVDKVLQLYIPTALLTQRAAAHVPTPQRN